MRKALPVLALLLLTCRGGPERRPLLGDDRDRLIALMGEIDAHLLGAQLAAGDPIEPDALRGHLAALRNRLEGARALRVPHEGLGAEIDDTVGILRELEGSVWTAENRADRYTMLRQLCRNCHSEFAPPVADGRRAPSSWESCGRCHEKVFKEWQGTLHANAWTDPVFRMSAGNPPKSECRSCHSMEPILEREISTAVSYRPVFRPYNHEEGVNCLSCHGLADGSVAAARDLPDAPCRPRRDPRLSSPEFCGACHNPSHGAYDEWRASGLSKTCADCHARPGGRFSHRMTGVADGDFVKAALGWSCETVGGELRLTLVNRSGHRLPAEVPSRTLRIALDLGGAREEIFLRRPPKASVGAKDTRLLPAETRRIARKLPGAGRVRVEIHYQRSPFERPEDWVKIAEWEKVP